MKKFIVLFFALAIPILSFAHQEQQQQLTLEERVAKLERVPTPPVMC